MSTMYPAQKITGGAIAGALTAIVIWVLKIYANAPIPGEVAAAITTVLTFVVSYLVPPAERDQITA